MKIEIAKRIKIFGKESLYLSLVQNTSEGNNKWLLLVVNNNHKPVIDAGPGVKLAKKLAYTNDWLQYSQLENKLQGEEIILQLVKKHPTNESQITKLYYRTI